MADYQGLDPRQGGGPQILGAAGPSYSSAHAGAASAPSPLYLKSLQSRDQSALRLVTPVQAIIPTQTLSSGLAQPQGAGLLPGSTPRLEGLHGPPDAHTFSAGLLAAAQASASAPEAHADAAADVAAACYSEDPRFSLSGAVPATQAQAHMLLQEQAAQLLHPQHHGDSQLMHHPLHPHHPPVFQVESQVSEHRKQQPKRQRRYGNGPAEPARRPQHSKPTRKCQVEDCPVQPSYNYPTETKRIYCRTHKKDGMVNLCNKNGCRGLNCHKSPRFNFPNVSRGIFCDAHKLEGMVNVTDRRCQHSGCTKHPTSNFPGQAGRVFCATHRREGMQDRSH